MFGKKEILWRVKMSWYKIVYSHIWVWKLSLVKDIGKSVTKHGNDYGLYWEITRLDRIRNEDVRKYYKQTNGDKVEPLQIIWIDHLIRTDIEFQVKNEWVTWIQSKGRREAMKARALAEDKKSKEVG